MSNSHYGSSCNSTISEETSTFEETEKGGASQLAIDLVLPLLSSENVVHSKGVSASHLLSRVQSKVGDIQRSNSTSNSLPRSKSLGVEVEMEWDPTMAHPVL
uniref:Uncharacterized protein n=1 Tax=Ditylenchus dipsaci TaxID=166011 RepID=A0A915DH56_9BILA